MDKKKETVQPTAPAPAPEKKEPTKFALNADDLGGDKFEGTILSAGLEDTKFGERIVVGVKVPFFEGPMRITMTPSVRKKSKWGIWLQRLKACGVRIEQLEDLVGTKYEFERIDVELGKNLNPIQDFPVPTKFLGKDE
jgi:hypothetical protein